MATRSLTDSDVARRCDGFVNMCVVTFLVIFELTFYFVYVVPVVEDGNVHDTARNVSEDLVHDYASLFDIVTHSPRQCASLVDEVRRLVPSVPADNHNTVIVIGAAAACVGMLVLLVLYWALRIRPHIAFPSELLARTLLPVAMAFVIYDFLYFTFLVKGWDTISGAEFLWEVVQATTTPAPVPK